MTAFPRRRTLRFEAPDPAGYVAVVTRAAQVAPAGRPVPGPSGTWRVLAASADAGHLVAGRTRTVAGHGAAATLCLPSGLGDLPALRAVTEWLGAVEVRAGDDAPASAVTAVGAFPFDPAAPAALVVPSRSVVLEDDGHAWNVDVRPRVARRPSPGTGEAGAPAVHAAADRKGDRPLLTEVPTGERYARSVAEAVGNIRAGRLRKIVLSRMVDVHLPEPVAASTVLGRLWQGDPAFFPFSVPTSDGRLVGASPELLVCRRARGVVSHAFAGTTALRQHDDASGVARLLASEKEREEHRLVVEAIATVLGPRCTSLEVPAAPTVVHLGSDARLGTMIRGTLGGDDTALSLLSLLHPTPAVGGVPQAAALGRIEALEPVPRGYWAGAVGWTDATGDGDWVLSIRSALLDGSSARVRAGAGIVAGSSPAEELAETTVKLSPVLDALWPGASSLL